jgi:YgiT-type zinc finger domain-containing protein
MKCAECNGNLKIITGDFKSKSKSLGNITVPEISYTICNNCGDILLDPEMAQKVTTFKKQRELELIMKLPVGEFLAVTEAIEILGITKQAFSKNNKIKRNFIYNIKMGKKKLYHKKSVELFKSTGDGRFLLSKQQNQSNKVEFKVQYDLNDECGQSQGHDRDCERNKLEPSEFI